MQEIRKKRLKEGWKEIDGVLYCKDYPYLLGIIRTKIISKYYNDPLVAHFRVKKTRELVAQKYYWPTIQIDIKAYVKRSDVCIVSKTVRHKLYGNLQFLSVPTHR